MNKPKISLCEICNTEITYPKGCKLCGKKTCHGCRVWYDITGNGQYMEPYCTECWELGIPYRIKIEQLIIKQNKKIIKLEEEWINRVKQDLAQGDN